jgi:hypothetical protein
MAFPAQPSNGAKASRNGKVYVYVAADGKWRIESIAINSVTDTLTVTGNTSGGNLTTAGILSVTGNANVGNLSTAGNITAGFFLGNGSQLTGIATGEPNSISNGNSNVRVIANSNVTVSVAGNANIITITGTGANVSGTANISGNVTGSNLNTGGVLSVTGNANVGNLGTAGLITATGNVSAGNLITSGGIFYANGNAFSSGGGTTIGKAIAMTIVFG